MNLGVGEASTTIGDYLTSAAYVYRSIRGNNYPLVSMEFLSVFIYILLYSFYA
jgi:hypothetical protein